MIKKCTRKFMLYAASGAIIALSADIMAEGVQAQERLASVTYNSTIIKPMSNFAEAIQLNFEIPALKSVVEDYDSLVSFYQARANEPFWVSRSGMNSNAKELVHLLEKSWTHGLNPYLYNLDKIRGLADARTTERKAALDILLSDAYYRYMKDLSGIRVDPKGLRTNISYWKQPLSAAALFGLLNDVDDVEDIAYKVAPKGRTYAKIRAELQDVVMRPAPNYETLLPININGLLRPGDRSDAIPHLRARLSVEQKGEDALFYDAELARAVTRFQRESGVKPDAIIGRQTLELLNVTRDDKIKQLIANLERLRWVDDYKPNKFIVVNIPSATLWAVDKGQVSFEMPVIVGKSKRPTNMFITEIHGVRFNPNWTVPKTIKEKDILPELIKNPAYLTDKDMELIMGQGADAVSIDPTSIDWSSMSKSDLKYFNMVQSPGSNNPLGRYRVLMPNPYNIYLHDTNSPEYFEKASRALSSGCIRMKDPARVADFIMHSNEDWSEDVMQQTLNKGKMRDLYIQQTIPVYLLYYTVWMNESEEIVYGRDLYRHDQTLFNLLSELDGIFIPVDNNGNINPI
ncbi:MAG: murein L,D-transpeptidase [Micavibrio sp.]|nr:murein L,D-transpeptidase [Micavibrio sp.]